VEDRRADVVPWFLRSSSKQRGHLFTLSTSTLHDTDTFLGYNRLVVVSMLSILKQLSTAGTLNLCYEQIKIGQDTGNTRGINRYVLVGVIMTVSSISSVLANPSVGIGWSSPY